MKLSTRARYATRILLYLAGRDMSTVSRKKQISDAEGISADYAEQILTRLKTAGLVVSRRGAEGGFQLARPPAQIRIIDVVEAAEGDFSLVDCAKEECPRMSACVTRRLWQKAEDAMRAVLEKTTLKDLVEEERHSHPSGGSYDI